MSEEEKRAALQAEADKKFKSLVALRRAEQVLTGKNAQKLRDSNGQGGQ